MNPEPIKSEKTKQETIEPSKDYFSFKQKISELHEALNASKPKQSEIKDAFLSAFSCYSFLENDLPDYEFARTLIDIDEQFGGGLGFLLEEINLLTNGIPEWACTYLKKICSSEEKNWNLKSRIEFFRHRTKTPGSNSEMRFLLSLALCESAYAMQNDEKLKEGLDILKKLSKEYNTALISFDDPNLEQRSHNVLRQYKTINVEKYVESLCDNGFLDDAERLIESEYESLSSYEGLSANSKFQTFSALQKLDLLHSGVLQEKRSRERAQAERKESKKELEKISAEFKKENITLLVIFFTLMTIVSGMLLGRFSINGIVPIKMTLGLFSMMSLSLSFLTSDIRQLKLRVIIGVCSLAALFGVTRFPHYFVSTAQIEEKKLETPIQSSSPNKEEVLKSSPSTHKSK